MLDKANIPNAPAALLTKKTKGKRLGKSIAPLKLGQIYTAPGKIINLSVCGDPDCGNYGFALDPVYETLKGANAPKKRLAASLKNSAIGVGLN